jgi:DNA-directed RNA polymerase subunit RPC12/RpoP
MDNPIDLRCSHCGVLNKVLVPETAPETGKIRCANCGMSIATFGQAHAKLAQEALGLGADELSDDHVPVGGPPFGETT